MRDVLVLAPAAAAIPPETRRALRIARYRDARDLASALEGSFSAAVLWSDGLSGDDLGIAAEAVRTAGRPVVEVQARRWDGFSHSPLSAACKGVISGFGVAGIVAAAKLLAES
jgi:3-dehydroquinate dehydratase